MEHFINYNVSLYLQCNLVWRFAKFHCILESVITLNKRNSDAKIRANNKYSAAHYDRINMALPKGSRRLIDYCAKQCGETTNRFVCRVVLEAVKRQLDAGKDQQKEFFDMF